MDLKQKRILLGLITVLFWFARYIYNPHMTPFLSACGFVSSVSGVIVGAYGFTQLVLRIPIGMAADITKKHKLFIAAGCLITGASALGFLLAPNEALFIIVNGMCGVASSMWISFTVLYSSYYPPEEGTKAISIINACNNGGKLLSYIIGGIVAQYFGIKPLFVIAFCAGLIGLGLSCFLKNEARDKKPVTLRDLITVVKVKNLLLCSVLGAVMQTIVFATAMSFTSSIAKDIGANDLEVSCVSAFYTAASVAGSFILGAKLYKKFSPRILASFSFALLAVYALLLPLCPSVWLLYLLQIIGGAANSCLFSLLMAQSVRYAPIEKKSSAMGFFQAIYSLGMTLGPVLMGTLIDISSFFGACAVIAAIALASCVFCALKLSKEPERSA